VSHFFIKRVTSNFYCYRNYSMFSDILCFRTPPIFHRNNYFLDAQKHVFFGHPLFSDTPTIHRNNYF